jgi:hypothetical protein
MISFVNTSKTASIDTVLEETTQLRELVSVKQAKTSSMIDGARVYAYHNNGLIIPGNLPTQGTKGTVVAVNTMSGRKTAMDGYVFVKWDGTSKITQAPLTNVRLASKRVSSLEGFYVVAGTNLEGELVHKSTKDLWSVKVGDDGKYDIERMFDDNGEPLKV